MGMKHKILFLMLAVVLAFATGCKKGEEAPVIPTEYTIGGETVSALAAYEGMTVTQTDSEESELVVYTYEGVNSPSVVVEGYVDQMTGEEVGFSIVDETHCLVDAPDYTAETGTVHLARAAAEGERLLLISLEWSEGTCKVTTDAQEGTITEPEGMTMMEALDFFRDLQPSRLGLEGSSMDEYQVYVSSGIAMVDNRPCLQLSVYTADNEEGTNELMGMYLMTGDGKHIYSVDPVTNGVIKR